MRFKPRRSLPLLFTAGFGALVAAALLLPSVVPAAWAPEQQQGGALAESLRSREKQCAELSADEFESIGELAMGRMHLVLGRRYSGCGGTSASSWLAPMTAMMGGGYRGSMMAADRHPGDTDIGALGVILIALAAAALGGGIMIRRRSGGCRARSGSARGGC